MKEKYICVVFFLGLLLTASARPVWAAELPKGMTDTLPPEAEQLLDGLEVGGYDHGSLLQGLERLAHTAWENFLHAIRQRIGGMVALVGVVLLCGTADELHRSAGSGLPVVTMAGALAIVLLSASGVRSLIGAGLESMEQLDIFSKALLPTLAAAVAASGGAISAGIGQVATVYFTNVLLSLIRHILLPLVYFYMAVSAADAVLPEHDLRLIRTGIGKLATWGLTGMLVLFTGFLTLAGVTGSSADAVTVRLTRSAISSAVPVVGGIIADAADSVLAGAGILKNAVGIFGMLGVLAICLAPFLDLAVQYLLYKLAAFLASTVGPRPLVELIDALASAFGLVLGMTGACAMLLLISVAASVSVVVT
ncbi:MAG: stage III sporulation protein AE [Ruminococcaceae bacterium]|nr:stage III sporulation protein AE [Oscillospiraceae bacterium]